MQEDDLKCLNPKEKPVMTSSCQRCETEGKKFSFPSPFHPNPHQRFLYFEVLIAAMLGSPNPFILFRFHLRPASMNEGTEHQPNTDKS